MHVHRKGPICSWDEPKLPEFTGPTNCTVAPHRSRPGSATEDGTLIRIVSCELQYGPLNCDFAWGTNHDVLDDVALPGVTACGVNMPSPDMLTPQRMESMVWSWAPGHPHEAAAALQVQGSAVLGTPAANAGPIRGGKEGQVQKMHQMRQISTAQAECSQMSAADGRWYVAQCTPQQRWLTCRSSAVAPADGSGPLWQLGDAAADGCPPDYTHDMPHTAKENLRLLQLLRQQNVSMALLPLHGPHFWPDWLDSRRQGHAHQPVANI